MASTLDQIKLNAVPAGVMRIAAKGALPVPPAETLQILVYLTHNPIFGQEATMTLAAWDLEATKKVVAEPAAPPEVLGYYWTETNRRLALMPTLIENPAISETLLMEAASSGSREVVTLLMASPRARSSPAVAEAMAANPAFTQEELEQLREAYEPAPQPAEAEPPATTTQEDEEAEAAHQAWYQKYGGEIAAEEGTAYTPVGGEEEVAPSEPQPDAGTPPTTEDASASMAAAALGSSARAKMTEGRKKMSALQRIGKMNVAERVKASFMGGQDERLILIRDPARVVQNAVLASPKLTEPEVEGFASAKNLHENVLREIARNRRFMKNYAVGRNLVNNPKCPLDLSLALVKNLMVFDLKSLRNNKGVPETLRQVAAKLYRDKTGPAKEIQRKG